MQYCCGQHSCLSSSFSIPMLNGTYAFHCPGISVVLIEECCLITANVLHVCRLCQISFMLSLLDENKIPKQIMLIVLKSSDKHHNYALFNWFFSIFQLFTLEFSLVDHIFMIVHFQPCISSYSSGDGGWYVIFRLFKSIFFCQLNFIVLFPFLIKYYHILYIITVFRFGCDRPSGLLLFVPALLLSMLTPLFLPSSSVYLSYFVLAVPMRECLGKHSCMSSPCPIAILNGTFLFREAK